MALITDQDLTPPSSFTNTSPGLSSNQGELMADLKTLIKQGEGISVEFKECRRTLNRDVYKSAPKTATSHTALASSIRKPFRLFPKTR